jgi:alpha-L-rhamnosidase
VRSVNDDLVANGYHFTAGIYGIRYALTMLTDHGYGDTAYRVATQTDEPSWGWWIVNGHSTMFEGWSLSSRSYDHHYFGSISSWFYEGLAGIRRGAPGYRSVIVRPHVPAGLERADGSIETVRGEVASAWERSGDRLTLRVRIPSNTPAEVWVPGTRVAPPRGARLLRFEDGRAVYGVGSGDHTFRSTLP